MSSVQDEANNGHAQMTGDEGNEEEEANNENVVSENDEIASFGTLEEPDELEQEESLIPNGATLDDSVNENREIRGEGSEGSQLPSRRALERPSSADGSLSIPDDTPSIQVLTS